MKSENADSSIEQARQEINAKFRDLNLAEIRQSIEQEFIDTGRIKLVNDLNNHQVVIADGTSSQIKARTLRLYSYALKLEKLRTLNEEKVSKRRPEIKKLEQEKNIELKTTDIGGETPTPSSPLYKLVSLPVLVSGDIDGANDRLVLFEAAKTEAGTDRELLELVIAQLFRQGLCVNPENNSATGKQPVGVSIGVTTQIDLWHKQIVSFNESLLNGDNGEELGDNDDADDFPMMDSNLPSKPRNSKWSRLRSSFHLRR